MQIVWNLGFWYERYDCGREHLRDGHVLMYRRSHLRVVMVDALTWKPTRKVLSISKVPFYSRAHLSSGWTVKSKKMKNISKTSEFFGVETLTKIPNACKISSKNDIRTSRGKRKTKSVLQNVFGNNIFGASILFLFCCDFHECYFVSIENFCQCLHPKNIRIFWIIFKLFLGLLFTRAHLSSGWERTFRYFRLFFSALWT